MAQEAADQLVDYVRSRYFGKYRGVVVDNADPTHRGRIKVRVPAVLGEQSVWAMPCVPYAGDNMGLYAIPEAGMGVWCSFEAGDPSFCIWEGCFWADEQRPADEKGRRATPPLKMIRTKEGLMVAFDDGAQTISVSDEDGSNILTIEVRKGQITVKGASKAVVEAPQIELVESSTHPVVFGDRLLDYLRNLELVFNTHMHPGQLAAAIVPVVPTTPMPQIMNVATPMLHSARVTTG